MAMKLLLSLLLLALLRNAFFYFKMSVLGISDKTVYPSSRVLEG
jgi:hypothetical protein